MKQHEGNFTCLFGLEAIFCLVGVLAHAFDKNVEQIIYMLPVSWFISGMINGLMNMWDDSRYAKASALLRTFNFGIIMMFSTELLTWYTWSVFGYWPLLVLLTHEIQTQKALSLTPNPYDQL